MEIVSLLSLNLAFLLVLFLFMVVLLFRSRKTDAEIRVGDDIAKIKEQIDPDYSEVVF